MKRKVFTRYSGLYFEKKIFTQQRARKSHTVTEVFAQLASTLSVYFFLLPLCFQRRKLSIWISADVRKLLLAQLKEQLTPHHSSDFSLDRFDPWQQQQGGGGRWRYLMCGVQRLLLQNRVLRSVEKFSRRRLSLWFFIDASVWLVFSCKWQISLLTTVNNPKSAILCLCLRCAICTSFYTPLSIPRDFGSSITSLIFLHIIHCLT